MLPEPVVLNAFTMREVRNQPATSSAPDSSGWESSTREPTANGLVAAMSRAEARTDTDDPFDDLVQELKAFQHGVSRPDGLSMVGTMLNSGTDPHLVELYRQRVETPRRTALRKILVRARRDELLDEHADLDVALGMLTGNWYARALAGGPAPARWADRTATLVWRALGGTPPER